MSDPFTPDMVAQIARHMTDDYAEDNLLIVRGWVANPRSGFGGRAHSRFRASAHLAGRRPRPPVAPATTTPAAARSAGFLPVQIGDRAVGERRVGKRKAGVRAEPGRGPVGEQRGRRPRTLRERRFGRDRPTAPPAASRRRVGRAGTV